MPAQPDEFVQKLRQTFQVEAQEHLQAMSSMLLELEKSASAAQAAELIENIYRQAHSLKGAARAVNMTDVEQVCQALEGVFAVWKRNQSKPPAAAFDALHGASDLVRGLIGTGEGAKTSPRPGELDDLIAVLQQMQEQVDSLQPPAATARTAAATAASAAPKLEVTASPPASSESPPPTPLPGGESDRGAAAQTVRISVAKLDSRLLQAEDLLTVKSLLRQRSVELRELRQQFDLWRRQWSKLSSEARTARPSATQNAAQSVAKSASGANLLDWHSDYFRTVGAKLDALASSAEQDRRTVGKRVDDLLEETKKLLMLPFSTLSEIFPKIVRDLCRDQGKDADLVVRGSELEIDKRILEELKDVFIHLLRNCVDHGVEKARQRLAAGKPQRATIQIELASVNGNKVEIRVSDDGAGIDVQKVKASAVQHGIVPAADAQNLSDPDAQRLIFHSEVSTSPVVTAISGRGLGMAIVREKIEKLGGSAAVQSQAGQGTTLRMVLPLTMATFRGILVSCADMTFVLPLGNVERVLLAGKDEIKTVENRESVAIGTRSVSVARLSAVLELTEKPRPRDREDALSLVVLGSGDQRIAFVVDQVLHEEEVLVKPLARPLLRVRNIAGATVLGSGKVVPILNVPDLIKSARKNGAAKSATAAAAQEGPARRKTILVVEDSVTSRMLLKGILESAGYDVKTAVDGIEAHTLLREGQFDLLVSDVEMPRMNGFDLTAKVRSDKKLAELPVVLVTALESPEQRERGIDAGANAYIVKSGFDSGNLLEVIGRLIEKATMAKDRKIRVLIVDDSSVLQMMLANLLSSDPQIQVIGTASNGVKALEFLQRHTPDVILMDLDMPEMGGFEATRRIMESRPIPIVICSGSSDPTEAASTFRAMEVGAVAAVDKPLGRDSPRFEAVAKQLLQTVKLMSEVKLVRRWRRREEPPASPRSDRAPATRFRAVGIGASTGGPPVLQTILSALPKNFSVPLLIVQHIAPGFLDGLVGWLNQTTGLKVQIGAYGMATVGGHVYLAPDDYHMTLNAAGKIELSKDEPENGLRPAVSRLFRSLAEACGPNAMGVLLTGMGRDGAAELKLMRDAGALTIAQDRESSVVHGMPGEAIALDAAEYILPPERIAATIAAQVELSKVF